ncbi:MAG: hypothetical protein ACFFCS_06850 [Candidatus Hodarchaeota archaeon]
MRLTVYIHFCKNCYPLVPKGVIKEINSIRNPRNETFLDALVREILKDYGLDQTAGGGQTVPASQTQVKMCPACGGGEVTDGMCYDCGAKICPKCGTPDTSTNPEVCSKCGTSFF